jgi:hypothetical protein
MRKLPWKSYAYFTEAELTRLLAHPGQLPHTRGASVPVFIANHRSNVPTSSPHPGRLRRAKQRRTDCPCTSL